MADIKVTELDFDILKENLKDFLRSQNEFQDYDFDGSGLQILLDILSANTHYNAIYQNMIANEMFLDSAILRESVVSRSKALGYTPSSIKSSQVEVSLKLVNSRTSLTTEELESQPSSIALPAFSNFSASKDNVVYFFQNTEGYSLNKEGEKSDGRYIYSNTFTIKQGLMVEQNFTVDFQQNPDQRYILENSNSDITTLIVSVKEPSSEPYLTSVLAENVVEVGSNDNVYWISENESGKYEVFFGNGRIGKKLVDGSLIKIQYLSTSGSVGNNINSGFYFSDILKIDGYSYEQDSISITSSSFGGSDKESIEDIRFTSPKYYEMQNRTVTALDYKYLVQKKYQNIDSIKVWGGEDNDPVHYGRVFISLKPKTGFFITNVAKENIVNDIVKDYNVVTIDAEIVEPTYTFIDLVTEIKYNLREVPQGEQYLKNQVLSSISSFNDSNLGKFDSYFRFSKLVSKIDDTSSAIKSNITSVKIKNRLITSLGILTSYVSKFNSEVVPGSLNSSKFSHDDFLNCFLEDDSEGNIKISSYSGVVKVTVKNNIGTINYLKGEINLSNFAPIKINSGESYIDLIMTPKSYDLSPLRNQIITIDKSTINITMKNISEQFLTQNKF